MNKLKFRYVYGVPGKPETYFFRYFTIEEIEKSGIPQIQLAVPLTEYKIISRDQFTGLKDKNGKEIYENDELNIFHTSYEGTHIHDSVFRVMRLSFEGIQLGFLDLLWESFGHNQLPIYRNLRFGKEISERMGKIEIRDLYESNHLSNGRWKTNDKSDYVEIIGNTHGVK